MRGRKGGPVGNNPRSDHFMAIIRGVESEDDVILVRYWPAHGVHAVTAASTGSEIPGELTGLRV